MMIHNRPFLCLIAGLLAGASAPAFAAAQSNTGQKQFSIPAQDLSKALKRVSEQSGVNVLFSHADTETLRAPELHGTYSLDEALHRLLGNSGLRAVRIGDHTISIKRVSRGRATYGPAGFADQATDSVIPSGAAAGGGVATVDDEVIIVTGTRATARTVTESLAPIDVLSREDLQSTGKQSTRDLLGTLTPSISVSNSGAGASFAVKTISLRGLSGDQVLVLVNGKRRHNTANIFINGSTQNGQSPPDLDLIPSNAIDHIEILRDGASAQYGSDAIAGVINVILKRDLSGGASVLGGVTGQGDGEQGRFQFNNGFSIGAATLHLSADAYMQDRTIRGRSFIGRFYPLINGQPDPRETTVDRNVNKPGQPAVYGGNFSYDFVLPVGTDMDIYSFGTYSERQADAYLTFRQPASPNNVFQIFPEGYIPRLILHDIDFQVAAGVRGTIGDGFNYDLSSSFARSIVRFNEDSLNASLGPASPTEFYIGTLRSSEFVTNLDLAKEFEIGLAGPLSVAIGAEYRRGTFGIGAGEPASYIDGGYFDTTGELANVTRVAGSQGVTGFPATAAGKWARNNWSAYINIEQKLTDGIEFALAGRHEDYSDFGTTDTGKASLRIEPLNGVAVRATVSTGFRAPTLQQQHYASSSTIGVTFPGASVAVLAPVSALPVDDPVAIALGATPLKPETSTNYSVGMVFSAVPRLNITADAYMIEIKDRILLSGVLTGAPTGANTFNGIGTILSNAGLNPVQSGFFFSNAASTRTRGLDVVATYKAPIGSLGSATFSLSANFNDTKFTRLDVPPVLDAIGVQLINRSRQGDFTLGTPRDKFIGNIFWDAGPASLNLRATRYGKVTQVSTNPALDDSIDPKVIFDIEVAANINEKIKIAVGANNLFDTYPTVLKPGNQGTTGFSYYNPYSPYGISGGFYYGKLTFTF